jgi:hypothetical protein
MEHRITLALQHPELGLPVGEPTRLRAECPCGWERIGAYSDELQEAYDVHLQVTTEFLLERYGAEEIKHAAPATAERVHLASKAFSALEDILEYVRQLETEAKGTPFQLGVEAIVWEIRNRAQAHLAPPVAPEGR